MPRPKSKHTDSAWAALLSEAIKDREVLPPGEGWRTMVEIRAQINSGQSKCYSFVQQAVECGKLEKFQGFAQVDGCLRRRVWYRPATK